MAKKYYVAYGSNLNLDQMQVRCPDARVVGTSTITDYQLLFKGSKTGSYLTIEREPGCQVPVAVWEVSAADEKALDRYEGCPHFYYKANLMLPVIGIRTGKVRTRSCFIYIMHEDRPLGIPSTYYMRTCLDGYHTFGFNEDYLAQAYLNSEKGVKQWKVRKV